MDAVKEKFIALERKGSELGLKVNDAKTKYMTISPLNRQQEKNVTIGTHTFKIVCWSLESIKLKKLASVCWSLECLKLKKLASVLSETSRTRECILL